LSKQKEVEALIKSIKEGLPENVELKFEVIDNYLTIKPKGWLADEFAQVQNKIKELGGEYISAGKFSHFRILLVPKEESLREYYDQQKKLRQPLTANLTIVLQLNIDKPEQLEKVLSLLKKNLVTTKTE